MQMARKSSVHTSLTLKVTSAGDLISWDRALPAFGFGQQVGNAQ